MTPVEAVKTRDVGTPAASATAAQMAATEPSPRLPVKALALPALTKIAAPAEGSPPRLASPSRMQAARVAERVYAAATDVPGAITASITSGRPR